MPNIPTTPDDYTHLYAYAQGYYDGRHEGIETNPYAHADPCRALYTEGYERGVCDFSEFDETP